MTSRINVGDELEIIMDRIMEVTGGMGGNAFLVRGAEKTVLIDCGMAYCASNLIRNIKQALNQLTLDYILISHSHYDPISEAV
jgi:flavorubredoxin